MSDSEPPELERRIASMGRGMLMLFWLCVAGVMTYGFQLWLDGERNPNSDPQTRRADGRVSVTLQRNRQNHYVATGSINGEEALFLLDTGATDVSVPASQARRLGLIRGPEGRAMTANGVVTVYLTPSMDGAEILLGMSALGQLDLRQTGNSLTLTR